MPQVERWFIGMRRFRVNCTFSWDAIDNQSVVLVSASEGAANVNVASSSREPNRFVGEALITIHNIAPFEGGVRFVVYINWAEPLPIWVDIVLLDEKPIGWAR